MIGFDTTKFPRLNFRDKEQFLACISSLQDFFEGNRTMLTPVFQKGEEFKNAFKQIDPFIQRYTAETCPLCGNVCCANRHGFPEYADIVGFLAMGLDIPVYDLDVDEGALCQFIGEKGCILPRPQRPYRCTWYFCDPLLVQIDLGPIKEYRHFISCVQELSARRGSLLNTFVETCTEHNLRLPR